MMAHSTCTASIVLVAALLITTLSYCSAENVYCVTPTTTSCSSCPHNSIYCATLSEYAQEAELYFTSNTTMVFLPGDHVLDRTITVANVTRLTMRGESSLGHIATVVRNVSVGFSFTNMVDFNIYSLAFTSYNRSQSYGSHPGTNFALFLQATQNARLVNCSFHDNLGTALVVTKTIITLEENNRFIQNQCACQSFSEMCGCGITAFNSSLTFTGNTIFQENKAEFSGAGAIWASASSLYFTGTNNFICNAGYVGGAVYVQSNTLLSLTGNDIFYHNLANYGGAIFTEDNAVLIFNGTINFTDNSALWSGGAIHAQAKTSLSFSGTSIFTHNSAHSGGGGGGGGTFYASDSAILTFSGSNTFNSSAGYNGGVIYISGKVVFTLNGINNFINNSAQGSGGGIYADGRSTTPGNAVVTFNGTNNFINNSAESYGGAIYAVTNTPLSFNGTSTFSYNTAYYGGVISVYYDNVKLAFNGTNNFVNNSARNGGAIHAKCNGLLRFKGTSNFIHNSADYGGAIFTWSSHNAVFSFNGTNNFFKNSAKSRHGGAIFIIRSEFRFNGSNNFTGNSANGNGGAIISLTEMLLSLTGSSSFSNNSAMQGGAISANRNSTLTFNGNISFTNNGQNTRDSRGGAMYLGISSTFSILPHTIMHWENNYATLGGAIYVMNANPLIYCTNISPYIPKQECFFQLPGHNIYGELVFKNNSANAAGSVLYGGAVDHCKLNDLNFSSSGDMFNLIFKNKSDNEISSDPFHVCLCENGHLNCKKPNKTLSVYPGETVQVSLVSTGQRNGIVPAHVRSHIDKGKLLSSQYVQQTIKMCTTLNYTVFSLQNVTLELYADGPCSTFGNTLVLQLNVNQTCPPGFSLANSTMSCVCDQALQKYTNHCNITNGIGRITRESDDTFWVGYDEQTDALTVHPHCPFDYCVNGKVVFLLNNTDKQCANYRSGLLCGACNTKQCNNSLPCNSTGYSLVLGSSHCKQCTNVHLLLLIPFALMGIALVFLLLVCKLTVATGTLSGLVLYANIVGPNRTIFLPAGSTDALSVFIAWLNLDFGIETCFYNGMDASSKTWLQFVFPVYIWMLVGLVVFLSHYSQRFAKLLGSNPVSVLATLVLLSYAKILRTCITAISPITLQYQYGRAWLYDANVVYFSGKHIPLFILAIFFFFLLFLPYTLLLLFGQWLQAISHLRLFSWVNSARLKPFMDSYHAPYKPKHRYWPGLLLVLRFVLTLVFALNHQQDPNINLLAIVVGAGILQLWAWVSGGVYKNWCLDALEGSFALNLIVLGVSMCYVKLSIGNKFVAGYTSVAIAFTTFIGILAYHIIQQLISTKLWKKVPKLNFELKKLNIKLNKKLNTEQAEANLNTSTNNIIGSGRFDQLREPLLDDPPQPTHSVV